SRGLRAARRLRAGFPVAGDARVRGRAGGLRARVCAGVRGAGARRAIWRELPRLPTRCAALAAPVETVAGCEGRRRLTTCVAQVRAVFSAVPNPHRPMAEINK